MFQLLLNKNYKFFNAKSVLDYIKVYYRTIRNRGLIRSLKTLHKLDAWFDIKYGTDTWHWVALEELDITSENKERGIKYGGTPSRHLVKILKSESFPFDSTFVDLGSGKGRTLMVAAKFNFKRIVGIEFSSKLCEIARRNISIY